jgi:hypothetical protein
MMFIDAEKLSAHTVQLEGLLYDYLEIRAATLIDDEHQLRCVSTSDY